LKKENCRLKNAYQFSFLKRHSRKSLPPSLFQREERLFNSVALFPPLKKGDQGGFNSLSKGKNLIKKQIAEERTFYFEIFNLPFAFCN